MDPENPGGLSCEEDLQSSGHTHCTLLSKIVKRYTGKSEGRDASTAGVP